MRERRTALGGFVPSRKTRSAPLAPVAHDVFEEFSKGTDGRKASTTMVFVRLLSKLMRDKEIGRLVVPIVPDEARTFGMEALFRQVGIYSHVGQMYEPVDMDTLLYYKEASDGQILEEGITEAGSMSSFIAAGTAYATHGVNTIPFFIYYSMFGFQRIGDLIWAAADSRTRGFMLGGTAGRTTLAGEGLQHQDGNSHLFAIGLSQLRAVRPGVRLRDGGHHPGRHPADVRRSGEHLLLPDGDERAVRDAARCPKARATASCKGMYRFRQTAQAGATRRAQLFGSGAILPEVIKAQEILESTYDVGADVWSVTSYSELYRDGHACERWNMLHPGEPPRVPYVTQLPAGRAGRADCRVRLREGAAGCDRPLVAASADGARDRRVRPQRKPGEPARLLRGGPPLRCRGDAGGAGARRHSRALGGAAGDPGVWYRRGEEQPRDS